MALESTADHGRLQLLGLAEKSGTRCPQSGAACRRVLPGGPEATSRIMVLAAWTGRSLACMVPINSRPRAAKRERPDPCRKRGCVDRHESNQGSLKTERGTRPAEDRRWLECNHHHRIVPEPPAQGDRRAGRSKP